ncbi:hypothetical protein D9619_008232 [Psilocybe cf. subviscida]|uniref:Uncharacterized protein n=1 Tax=Psilocybe cf. subviscida TaxID=2480587 RepID=A0A8H5AU00_9AGAR|nr:hypothetical protein D9619_008232 [Psilocybe cf. subviscida]
MDFEHVPSLASDRTVEMSRPNSPASFNLTFDGKIPPPRIYDAEPRMTSFSPETSIMHTAIEHDPYSPMTFVNSPILPKQQHPVGTNEGMTLPTTLWTAVSVSQMSSPSICSNLSASSSVTELDTWMPSAVHDRPQAMQAHQYLRQRLRRGTKPSPGPTPPYACMFTPNPVPVPVSSPMLEAGTIRRSTTSTSSTLSRLMSRLFARRPPLSPATPPPGTAVPAQRNSAAKPSFPYFLSRKAPAAVHQPPAWSHHAHSKEDDLVAKLSLPCAQILQGPEPDEYTAAYAFIERRKCRQDGKPLLRDSPLA